MSAAFLAGVAAGYGVALPMGAIGVLIASLSARTSLRVGAAAGLGAATADGVFAAIAVAGGAAIAGVIAPVAAPLRWVAAVVLLALAAATARAAVRRSGAERSGGERSGSERSASRRSGEDRSGEDRSGEDRSGGERSGAERSGGERSGAAAMARRPATPWRAYAGVLGLTLLNPATVIYFAALVLGKGGEGGGALFVTGVFLASASWQLVIAGGGSLVGRWLTGERGRIITALVSSAVIAILAVRLLLPA